MFAVVLCVILIPLLPWHAWMVYWLGAIAVVRLAAWVVGAVKYRTFAALHTWANKLTGIACVLIPVLYPLFGLSATAAIVGTIASLSALEELAITLTSPRLVRNVRSIVCGAATWDGGRFSCPTSRLA